MVTPDGVAGPAWLDDARVNIVAKASSPDTSDEDLRLMVRNLLEDRMILVSHIENREQRVLAPQIWKDKAKLIPSEKPRTAEEGDCTVEAHKVGLRAVCKHMSMARLAHDLPQLAPRYLDQRVVDASVSSGPLTRTLKQTER